MLKFLNFFAGGVTGSIYIGDHFYKVSVKNIDGYPTENAILCWRLNDSTSKRYSNTWLSRDGRRRAF